MDHEILDSSSQLEVSRLFTSVFTDSEGEAEGKLLGNLASELSAAIDNKNVFCFAACEQSSIIGALFFSYLNFNEAINVYMLAPVAVSTRHQGLGIGQALIRYGIREMRSRSVDVVITYGDPSFYSKAGFHPLSEDIIKAP